MRVIVAAAGTGGHIYPAIAIIDKIKENDKNSEVLYIGTTDRMEKDIIPGLGIEYRGIPMAGIDRKNIFKNVSVFIKYKKAISSAKKIIKEFKPDVVVGVGGYISAPVIYAAHKLKVKVVIHEQNSIPGMTNKMVAKYASKICVSMPDAAKYFDSKKVVYTGNPRSQQIIDVPKIRKSAFNIRDNKKLVIIVMGSLGSTTISAKLKEMISSFSKKDYEVMIVTGKKYFDSFKKLNCPENVTLVPFLENFINLLKDTDLIVSRAGASTIAEITAIGLPSILVPSPYVTNNHQFVNAKELEDAGACKILEEKDFSSETLVPMIDEVLNNTGLYNSMKLAAKGLGVTDSADRVYNVISKLVGENNE